MECEESRAVMSGTVMVRGIVAGDTACVRRCYEECRDTFRRSVRGLKVTPDDLKDIFHESFEILWSRIDNGTINVEGSGLRVRRKDGTTAPVADLTGTYFNGIVRNKILEFCRRNNRMVPLEGLMADEEEDVTAYTGDDDPRQLKDRLTLVALNTLPHSCIDILTKFYHDCMTLQQILAERPENSSYDGLKTRKTKCLKRLKEQILTLFKAHGLPCP